MYSLAEGVKVLWVESKTSMRYFYSDFGMLNS